jgi:hypothetical protein
VEVVLDASFLASSRFHHGEKLGFQLGLAAGTCEHFGDYSDHVKIDDLTLNGFAYCFR